MCFGPTDDPAERSITRRICVLAPRTIQLSETSPEEYVFSRTIHVVAAASTRPPLGERCLIKCDPTVSIKGTSRTGAKIADYEREKGPGKYPYSAYVGDSLRASVLCENPCVGIKRSRRDERSALVAAALTRFA